MLSRTEERGDKDSNLFKLLESGIGALGIGKERLETLNSTIPAVAELGGADIVETDVIFLK